MSQLNTPPAPTPIDQLLGANIRKRRLELELSMSELGDMVGLSHQQIQKYETGVSRISAPSLFTLAKTLKISVPDLYDQWDQLIESKQVKVVMPINDEDDIIINYRAIPGQVKPHVKNLIMAMAGKFKPDYR